MGYQMNVSTFHGFNVSIFLHKNIVISLSPHQACCQYCFLVKSDILLLLFFKEPLVFYLFKNPHAILAPM